MGCHCLPRGFPLPYLNYHLGLAPCERREKGGWVDSSFSLLVYLLLLVFTTIFTRQRKWCGTSSEMQIHVCTWTFWRIEFVADMWFYTFYNELTCSWVPNTSGKTKFYSVLPFSLKWDVQEPCGLMVSCVYSNPLPEYVSAQWSLNYHFSIYRVRLIIVFQCCCDD